jgi:hypothetical protein
VAVSSSLLWMISSSALIIANKQLYDGPLPYPMMVTGLGQVSASAPRPLQQKPAGVTCTSLLPPAMCVWDHPAAPAQASDSAGTGA